MTQTYAMAFGFEWGLVDCEDLTWPEIVKLLTKHTIGPKNGRYFVAGQFSNRIRDEANLTYRSLITFDLDKSDGRTIDNVEFALTSQLPVGWVAYSTWNSTSEVPRIRIAIPLSRPVTPDEYRLVSEQFAAEYFPDWVFDNCSFKPNQFMFLPRVADLATAWSAAGEGEPYPVPDIIQGALSQGLPPPSREALLQQERIVDNPLEVALKQQPIDLSEQQVDAYLDAYPAQGLEYDPWLKIGAALNHQFLGSDAGFNRWIDWSAKSDKHDPAQMERKWKSFGGYANPITFRSIIAVVNASGGLPAAINTRREFEFTRVGDLKYRAPQWVIEGLVETETLGLLFGEPGCGKSFVAVDMALSVATGVTFHGKPVKKGPVFYIAGEGFNGLTRRFRAWAKHRKVDIDGASLFVSKRAAQFLDAASAKAVTEAVRELAAEHGAPALIFIDTVARNFGAGDENSTSEMGAFIAAMDSLRAEFVGCALVLVHHSGHSDKQRARGSIALKGALDVEFRLDKVHDTITLTNTKMKDAEPPAPMHFELVNVDLEEGGSSAALVDTERKERVKPLSPNVKMALSAYKEAAALYWDKNGGDNYQPIHRDEWRAVFMSRHTGDNQDSKTKAFRRAREDLVKIGRLEANNDIYTLVDLADITAVSWCRKDRPKRDGVGKPAPWLSKDNGDYDDVSGEDLI